ncbi:hypothetical protein RFI_14592, partial [Reticulomyxa filosa]
KFFFFFFLKKKKKKAIRLNSISSDSSSQIFTKMLCPFEEIKQFLKTKATNDRRVSTILSEDDVPELDIRRRSKVGGRTATVIKIVEPCGFLLPSLLKDLQDFITVVSNFEFSSNENKTLLIEQEESLPAPMVLGNWHNDLTLQIHEARIICLENVCFICLFGFLMGRNDYLMSYMFVHNIGIKKMECIVSIIGDNDTKNSNITSVQNSGQRCNVDNTWDLDISSLSIQVCPVEQISIRKSQIGDTSSIHKIINKSSFKCHVKQEDLCSLNRKLVFSTSLDCSSQLKQLEFCLSFVDLHIFNNIIKNIRERFNPDEGEPLNEKINRLVPPDRDLRSNFHRLKKNGYTGELCFEAILHCPSDYNLALQYCRNNEASFDVRFQRGDISAVTDLLPCWMYHNYRELSLHKHASEEDILRALLLSDNDIDTASRIIDNIRLKRTYSRSQSFISVSDIKTEDERIGDEKYDEEIRMLTPSEKGGNSHPDTMSNYEMKYADFVDEDHHVIEEKAIHPVQYSSADRLDKSAFRNRDDGNIPSHSASLLEDDVSTKGFAETGKYPQSRGFHLCVCVCVCFFFKCMCVHVCMFTRCDCVAFSCL